jgi:cytosine/adenosine deaminase-related metal-dependent hydrolase
MADSALVPFADPELLGLRLKLSGSRIKKRIFVSTGSVSEKQRLLPAIKQLMPYNVTICATEGTSTFLGLQGVPNMCIRKINEGGTPNAASLLRANAFDLVVNILTGDTGYDEGSDAKKIRSLAIEYGVPLITDTDVALETIAKLVLDLQREPFIPAGDDWDILKHIRRGVAKRGGFANYHAHLDKAYLITPERLRIAQIAMRDKWRLYSELKSQYTIEDLYERIKRGLLAQIDQGTTHFRTLVDADSIIGVKGVEAALMVQREFRNQIRFEIGTQPLEGVRDPETRRFFEKACEMVDVVGGLPSRDRPEPEKHFDIILQIAKSLGKRVDVHVDQENSPEEDETRLLALKTMEHGMQGRVSAIHSISVGCKPVHEQEEVAKMLADAGVSVIVCPSAALSMEQREQYSTLIHNSIAPVVRFRQAGVKVVLGVDNIHDFFMPFVDGDMMTEVRMLAEATRCYDAEWLADIACDKSLFT